MNHPKKILYYESGSGYGGSAVSLYRLIKNLDYKTFYPFVLVHGIGPRIKLIKKMGVKVNVLQVYKPVPTIIYDSKDFKRHLADIFTFYTNFASNTIINTSIIVRFIKRHNISLVHLNNGIIDNFSGLLAAKLCQIPCVSHIRGTEPLTKIESLFGRYLDRIITLNSVMENLYSSVFGYKKSCIIFNGVDLDAFEHVDRHKIRNDYKVGADCFLVGTIARIVPGKGIPEFIKAASDIIRKNKKINFFIIGDGPKLFRSIEQEMKQLVSDLHIEDRIVFTGWRDDVIDLMSGLDLVVQVSTFPEGMSLTPIEAMALGKPVIVSNVPGYTDTVEEGLTGFIVPPSDTEALAQRILKLENDRCLAKQLGSNGLKKVLKEFDARITAKKVQDIYHKIFMDKGYKKLSKIRHKVI